MISEGCLLLYRYTITNIKNLLKELLNYKTQIYTELDEEKILELYNKLVYKLSVINTF